MSKNQTIPTEIRFIVPFTAWSEKHPILMNIIFAIEAVIMFLIVLFYNFTTNF